VGAICGLGLLVSSFLPWYSSGDENATAWQAFSVTDLVILAASIAGLVVGIVVLFRLSVSYPIAGCAIAAGFGLLAFACILFRLIDPPGNGDIERQVGVWLGLIAAAGVGVGGYLGMQEPSWHPDAAGTS